MSQTWKIIIAVIITAVIVGGSIYLWQNKFISRPQVIIEKTAYILDRNNPNPIVYKFRHECFGMVVPTSSAAYCQGKNVLAVSKNNGGWKTLRENTVTSTKDAFILEGEPIVTPSDTSFKPHILLAYNSQSCKLDEEYCGVGLIEYYINLDFNTEKMEIRDLINFPISYGSLAWDNAGHVAYVKASSGDAGYQTAPVSIYDLTTDTVRIAIVDEAVSDDWHTNTYKVGNFPFDVDGASLPYWSDLYWNSKEMRWYITKHDINGKATTKTFAW
jgi:hypothetical protein